MADGMIMPPQYLSIDDLTFEIRWSVRRETIGVTVDRDGSLILHAPVGCALEHVEAVAHAKQSWVYTKIAQKELLQQPHRQREFVPGEGFFYLGRSYRLRLVEESQKPLGLYRGWFELRREEQERGRHHFVEWYRQHALPWIGQRVELLADRAEGNPASVSVITLGNRWGSCTQEGRLHFHWRTILLPAPIAEYVIAHEIVHLHEHRHSPAFWLRLERLMPDCRQRNEWLARHGAEYDI